MATEFDTVISLFIATSPNVLSQQPTHGISEEEHGQEEKESSQEEAKVAQRQKGRSKNQGEVTQKDRQEKYHQTKRQEAANAEGQVVPLIANGNVCRSHP